MSERGGRRVLVSSGNTRDFSRLYPNPAYSPILVFLLLYTLAVSSSLYSNEQVHVSAGTSNDSITLGFGDNADDIRSYGVDLSFFLDDTWKAEIDLNGFTLRGNETVLTERYDTLTAMLGYRFSYQLFEDVQLNTSAAAGGTAVGNLGLQDLQNRYHEMRNIPLVLLPYDSAYTNEIMMTYQVSNHVVREVESFFVDSIVFDQKYRYIEGYETAVSAGIYLRSPYSFIDIGIGYNHISIHDDSILHGITAISESGIYSDVNIRMGIIEMTCRYFPESQRSWGRIGITTDSFSTSKNGEEPFPLSFSLSFLLPLTRFSISLNYDLNQDMSVVFTDSFYSRIINEHYNMRENTGSWHVGIEWHGLDESVMLIKPFASISAGVQHVGVYQTAVNRIGVRDKVYSNLFPIVHVEGGGRFSLGGNSVSDGYMYSLEAAGGITYAFFISESVGWELRYQHALDPYVRIGVNIKPVGLI